MKKITAILAAALLTGTFAVAANPNRHIDALINTLWKTSPLKVDKERLWAMYQMQTYMDSMSRQDFAKYLSLDEPQRRRMENGTAMRFYRRALDKLVAEIPATKVEQGSIAIWHLYNMGYVVKTPSHCFAVDLKHPDAAKLVPFIEFLMVTHHHGDHYTDAMNKAMAAAGKKVFTNWDSDEYPTANIAEVRDIDADGIRIHTEITDHNKTLKNYMVTYLVDCGDDTKNVRLYFVGDSHNWEQLNPKGPVDIFVPHIHVGLNICKAAEKIQPEWVLSSHVLELGHDLRKWRWSYASAFDVSHEVHRRNVFVPVWGDKMIYRK